MSEKAILTAIEQSWPAQVMHDVTWLFAAFETIHFIGLCLLMGAMLVVDLRLIGLMRQVSLKAVLTLLPIAIGGFILNLVSGLAFFVSNPLSYWPNPAFKLKMVLVLIAGLNALYFEIAEHRPIKAADPHGDTHRATKISAGLSLGLWLLIIFWGRAIPTFEGSTSLF
jgi:hypothetical protein